MNVLEFNAEKRDSTYDFEFTKEAKDALSIAPSRIRTGGGGESVYSGVSRLHTSHSHTQRPWTTSVGGNNDDFSVAASTSMSKIASLNGKL